jgi:hypothetical protein
MRVLYIFRYVIIHRPFLFLFLITKSQQETVGTCDFIIKPKSNITPSEKGELSQMNNDDIVINSNFKTNCDFDIGDFDIKLNTKEVCALVITSIVAVFVYPVIKIYELLKK